MIQFAKELPQVLQVPPPNNSISMVRALRQIHTLLEDYASIMQQQNAIHSLDAANASIDDVETMLEALK